MNLFLTIGVIVFLCSPVWADEDLVDRYDENTEITVRGVIVEVVSPQRGPVVIKVVAEREGRAYRVVTAPQWFLTKNNISFKVGDKVEVIGSKFVAPNGTLFVITRQCMLKGSSPCAFRDEEMRPRWRCRMMCDR